MVSIRVHQFHHQWHLPVRGVEQLNRGQSSNHRLHPIQHSVGHKIAVDVVLGHRQILRSLLCCFAPLSITRVGPQHLAVLVYFVVGGSGARGFSAIPAPSGQFHRRLWRMTSLEKVTASADALDGFNAMQNLNQPCIVVIDELKTGPSASALNSRSSASARGVPVWLTRFRRANGPTR